jgi:ABC-2 type transport system permease protein
VSVAAARAAIASERAPRHTAAQALRFPTLWDTLLGFGGLLEATVRTKLAYRAATLTSVFVALLGQSVFFLVWLAVYQENSAPTMMAGRDLFSYLVVALVFNATFSFSVEFRFGQRLRQGLIASDLIRPLGFLPFQMAQAAGDAVVNLLFSLPIYALGLMFVGRAALPAGGVNAVLGVLSLGLAFLINFGLSYLLIEVALLTHSTYGAVTARLALHQAFSGLAAPLALFPASLREVASWLPFRDIIATPVQIWLGWQPIGSVFVALLRQACWAGALLVMGGVMLHGALTRHQIQGG